VAGPIVRAKTLLPQLSKIQPVSAQQGWDGLRLIVFGYFKKVVIADHLAPFVDAAFATADVYPSSLYWWLISALFALQIYADFSGYTDIARGLGKWMGLEFPENFNRPYLAASFREFWTRWHISLSTWFRDYIYIPLGGSKGSAWRRHFNMWLTMLISGLWHGAAWTFVCWGAFHAAMLSLERITNWPKRLAKSMLGHCIVIVLVFGLVCIGWILFRANSITQAWSIWQTMFTFQSTGLEYFGQKLSWVPMTILTLFIGKEIFHEYLLRHDRAFAFWQKPAVVQWSLVVMVLACVFLRGPGQQFIYFQF